MFDFNNHIRNFGKFTYDDFKEKVHSYGYKLLNEEQQTTIIDKYKLLKLKLEKLKKLQLDFGEEIKELEKELKKLGYIED